MSKKHSLLLATGQKEIDVTVQRKLDYEIVGIVDYKSECEQKIREALPDILLIGEGLSGTESTIALIMRLTKDYPKMRIIYLAGYVDIRDEVKIQSLGMLVMAGVYDIVHDDKLTMNSLKNLFENPKTYEQMQYLVVKTERGLLSKTKQVEFEIPDEIIEEESTAYNNLYVISSIKPGTGKSFVSTNIAAAIAAFGKQIDGKKPKVALVEADLQNLSVGTLLQIENDKKNLKTAIDKISTIINDKGQLTGGLEDTEAVTEYILECFQPYYKLRNLECLVGSQLAFDQLESVKPYHYVYLIESILEHYDVVIVDTNSSLTHVTTFPLLAMARYCYYILNLDFNNVRNNTRYQRILMEMDIFDKVRYVLNEDIPQADPDFIGKGQEELIFTADILDDSDFKLEARIPQIDKAVFLNRIYNGTPIVLDENKYTLKARYELLKLANQIYPIQNFERIEREVEEMYKRKEKRGLLNKKR